MGSFIVKKRSGVRVFLLYWDGAHTGTTTEMQDLNPKKENMKNDDKANFITLYSTNDRKRRWNREHNTHEHEHTRKLENGNRAK